MKRIFKGYRELIGIIYRENPLIVILCIMVAVLSGAANPIFVWVNRQVLSLGTEVAAGRFAFSTYIPYLVLFVVCALLPQVLNMLLWTYIYPASQLILRTAYKGKMLQKLKKMRYEHLENQSSMEIIDKAYDRAEVAALHLFPKYMYNGLSSFVAVAGIIYLFGSVRWWLPITLLGPFVLETYLRYKNHFDIYEEMESYWNKEHQYEILSNILKSRDYVKENRLFGSSDYLIDTYRVRLNGRNREYERYYFMYLKKHFTSQNISRFAQIGNALLILWIYSQDGIDIGQLIALTLAIFTSLWNSLREYTYIFQSIGSHIKGFEYYDKYFDLSEDNYGKVDEIPEDTSIEFVNVCFTYPGTDKQILHNMSFTIKSGEKISIVGENGEGKTTMVKLLLGLFQPDSGEIRVGGRPLSDYSQSVRERLFGPVFQDFVQYSISLHENIAVGDVNKINDRSAIEAAMKKAKVDVFANQLAEGGDTLLGRDFEGGVDISGGQWQRVAIARAFMGDKPILILDEPTSQLDPMAESELYSEFAQMSDGKTAIFITHRLGSTMITDRILVISGGRIIQSGSHGELMEQGGIYAEMFNSQKQWYVKNGEVV
ncbi:MAG: ABC transporter ATP-binding protein [Clostridiales bacterium]|nr:ABC transporter ATP-binding protein [Clostridiales bacterium]